MKNIYEHLLAKSDEIKVIDTHEHLNPHKNYLGDSPDILCDYLSHYITTDLASAGMKGSDLNTVRDCRVDLIQRFKILEPYWEYVKNTSYFRSLEIASGKIHKIPEISIKTIEDLNEKFKKAVNCEDYRRYIMKDVCNIEVSVNDFWSGDMKDMTTDLFVSTWHPESYIYPDVNPNGVKLAATLDEYCEAYKQHFLKQVKDGMKALKSAIAYGRSLYFEDVDYAAANALYSECVSRSEKGGEDISFPKKLQDYIMHYILKIADENNFVIQIHTGLQEGMGNNLENSNPMLLKNLFGKYKNLTFDLFHLGYPYERELIVLAKTHENVFVDMCWAHIISPYASRAAFSEMLDVLPYNKIFGFGGDYLFYDGVVGHITLAKQDICCVLANKIKAKEINIDLAEKILSAVLYDNAKRVFKL